MISYTATSAVTESINSCKEVLLFIQQWNPKINIVLVREVQGVIFALQDPFQVSTVSQLQNLHTVQTIKDVFKFLCDWC